MAGYDRIPPLLTVREAAQVLHVHPNTLKRWTDRGRIRAYRVSERGDRRYANQDIDRFLAQLISHNGDERHINVD